MRGDRKSELIETIQKLHHRIHQLEQVVNQLSRPVIEHVTIERVYLQNPVLERLEFGLDSIDIKELSGALNLGNNFGVNVEGQKQSKQNQEVKPKSKQSVKDPVDKPAGEGTQEDVNPESELYRGTSSAYTKEKTSSGYRFTVQRKDEN